MTHYLAAAGDAQVVTWQDVVITLASLAFMAFIIWLMRD